MYTEEQIAGAKNKIQELIKIVHDLETTFEGRHFTMDGHLVGSIGEVMAAYYYGISLYEASAPVHDGTSPDGREVQIKMTQGNQIAIGEEPRYLIALHMNRLTGEITEIYNGPGRKPWNQANYNEKHNIKYMRVAGLVQLDAEISLEQRIAMIHDIEKYGKTRIQTVKERAQDVKEKRGSQAGKTLLTGYVNRNNQENVRLAGHKGTLPGQKSYQMKCLKCGYEYEANGCDVWLRKCPRCQ